MITDFLILGKGYCGSRLAQQPSSIVTSRTPQSDNDIYFELQDRASWTNLPKAEHVIWTFACVGDTLEEEFFEYLQQKVSKKIIIYSTSSVYIHDSDMQVIDESTPINKNNIRAASEEKLRQKGAAILTLCGIFGPNRNPKNWLTKGLIKDPNKDVNLIHVNDIIELTFILAEKNIYSKRINLCPGESDSWQDLASHYSYEFPQEIEVKKSLRKTVKSSLLESILEKSYSFLRVRDLPVDL